MLYKFQALSIVNFQAKALTAQLIVLVRVVLPLSLSALSLILMQNKKDKYMSSNYIYPIQNI